MSDIQAASHTLYPPLSGNVFTTSKAGLGVPQNVSGNAGSGSVLFSWDAVAGATSYDVIVDSGAAIQLGDVQQYNAVGPNGTPILFQVIARAGGTTGGASSSISGTPNVSTGGGESPADTITLTRAELNDAGAGRAGLFADQSELSTTGEHVFLIARTHGTQGAVSVQYSSHGDSHDSVSGTVNWADGDGSYQAIRVNVPNKTAGDHRIFLQLSNPAGGLTLHFGVLSRGYGVIDDGTIAPDSEAVFFDTTQGTNGAGTQNSPYNNIYDAIANVGSKRYIYGRGVVVPDGTNTAHPYGSSVRSINAPATRADEDTRVYIRNFPGQTLTIQGDSTNNTFGFLASSNESYHTYRGISFLNLSTRDVANADGGAIWYHYGSCVGINIELCVFDGIDGATGTNSGGANLYGVFGGKVWRCTFANITMNGGTNGNTGGVYSYHGNSLSVQRCVFESSMSRGIYQKRVLLNDVSISSRFNIFRDCYLYYGISGGGDPSHAGISAMCNAFIGVSARIIHHSDTDPATTGENEICNNVLISGGASSEGPIENYYCRGLRIHHNVYHSCQNIYTDSSNRGVYPVYLNFNTRFASTGNVTSINYVSRNAAQTATIIPGACANDSTADPQIVDINGEDFSLTAGSPSLTAGMGGGANGILMPQLLGAA